MIFRELPLCARIAMPVLSIAMLAFLAITWITASNNIEAVKQNTEIHLLEIAKSHANKIKGDLESNYTIVEQLHALALSKFTDPTLSRDNVDRFYKKVLEESEGLFGVWALYDPNKFDGKDSQYFKTPGYEKTGAYGPYWTWGPDGKSLTWENDIDYVSEFYTVPKKLARPVYMEPYYDEVGGENVYMTSIIIPIHNSANQFYGLVGIDITLAQMAAQVDTVKPFPNSRSFLISTSGRFISHPENAYIGKNVDEYFKNEKIKDIITTGRVGSVIGVSGRNGEENYYSVVPISLAKGNEQWTFLIQTPTADTLSKAKTLLVFQVLIAAVFFVILSVTIIYVLNKVSFRMINLTQEFGKSENLVAQAAQQLNNSGAKLAAMSGENANSLEKLGSSLKNISKMTAQSSGNMEKASQLLMSSMENAKKSDVGISSLTSVFAEISEATKKLEVNVTEIEQLANQASKLSGNLSQDQGNDVKEVGLDLSMETAKQIAQISQQVSKSLSTIYTESLEKIDRGTQRATAVERLLKEVLNNFQTVNEINNQVNSSRVEQANEVEHLTQIIKDIEKRLQGNAAVSQEVAATSIEIQNQVEYMNEQVDELQKLIRGHE